MLNLNLFIVTNVRLEDEDEDEEFPDLSADSEYSQRFQAQQHKQHYCTIRLHSKKRWVEPVGSLCWVIFSPLYPLVSHHLSDVKLEDTNMHYFRFMTDKDIGKWIGFSLSDS